MAFTSIIKYKNEEEDGKIQNLEQIDFSQEQSDDEEDLQDAYDKLFEIIHKLKKKTRSAFKSYMFLNQKKKDFWLNLSSQLVM